MLSATERRLVDRFRQARRDPGLTVLEGFHAVKHGLRFGATVVEAVTADPDLLRRLAADLAPDLIDPLGDVRPVSDGVIAEATAQVPRTGIIAIARRREADLDAVLADRREAPVVLLEDPRNMANMGACVRVAAAADAAAVLTTGTNDPWHPDAVRGSAGLHYALPVERVPEVPRSDRPLIAIDPGGEPLGTVEVPRRAILAFGTERYGLTAELLARADERLRIPMRPGVSSLNLATAVAAVLFGAGTGSAPARDCPPRP